jgi:phage FluMu protein Com
MSETLTCPNCAAVLRRTAAMEPGVSVECPRCEKVFVAPEMDGQSPETVRSQREHPAPPRRAETQPERKEMLVCPGCSAKLERTAAMEPGVSVQCPRCERVFVAPDAEGQAPVTYTDRRGEAPAPRRALPIDEAGERPRRRENFGPNWKADLGEWFSIAGQAWSRVMGPTVGYLFLTGLILAAVIVPIVLLPLILSLEWQRQGGGGPAGVELFVGYQILQNLVLLPLSRLLMLVLFVGVLGVAIRQLRGREWSFGSFFMGFRHLSALSVYWLFQELLGFIVSGPVFGMVFLLPVLGPGIHESFLIFMGIAYLWYAITGIMYLYIYLRWVFALPLILDQGMPGWAALKTSWAMTKNHVLILFAAMLIQGMIFLAGYIACGIGLLFAASYVALLYAAMYLEALYPRRRSTEAEE